jgi:PTH1 family peptidyl-tRNA hydrolase
VWVVLGLGNPGRRYQATRHNVGFRVVDRLAKRWGVTLGRAAHQAVMGDVRRGGTRVLLVKPKTFMNASGEAVGSLKRFYRFETSQLIAVQDDVDLPPGRVRLRTGGGAGGNRGIASLIEVLGDPSFIRVKVGVGRPPTGPVAADYVLAAPTREEAAALETGEERAAEAVELVLSDGPAHAMNRINQKEAPYGGPPL